MYTVTCFKVFVCLFLSLDLFYCAPVVFTEYVSPTFTAKWQLGPPQCDSGSWLCPILESMRAELTFNCFHIRNLVPALSLLFLLRLLFLLSVPASQVLHWTAVPLKGTISVFVYFSFHALCENLGPTLGTNLHLVSVFYIFILTNYMLTFEKVIKSLWFIFFLAILLGV